MDASSLLAGGLLGFAAGLVAGPVIRAAIAADEYRRASAEAALADELLRRFTEDPDQPQPSARP